MREPQFEPGTVLAEKYRLDSRLGEGGMGTVYRATHLLLKAPVAIKVIDREVSEGEVAFTRFMREAQAAASLRSPHVVQVLDYGTEMGRPYMVMELLEGESLAGRINRLGTLTPQETYRVLTHMARAMAKAHESGIIHRDLKPDNVFLVHNEGDELAKVLDFGVAKVEATALAEGGHTRTGSLLGTPYYMSPEQAQGNKQVDHRSDLWAMGVIAFECLTGKRPFSSDGLGEVVLQICIRDIPRPSDVNVVPEGFDAWFARATERDVDTRFQSAREMVEALAPALGIARELPLGLGEGPWSTAAPVSHLPSLDRGRQVEEATTERDRESPVEGQRAGEPESSKPYRTPLDSPLPDGPQRIHRTEGQGGARWEESVEPPEVVSAQPEAPVDPPTPQDSQWEIVPHGQAAPPSEAIPRRNLALELALEEDKRRPTGMILLGVLFLILGAAGVLFMQGFGAFSPDRPNITRTRTAIPHPSSTDQPADPATAEQADDGGTSPQRDRTGTVNAQPEPSAGPERVENPENPQLAEDASAAPEDADGPTVDKANDDAKEPAESNRTNERTSGELPHKLPADELPAGEKKAPSGGDTPPAEPAKKKKAPEPAVPAPSAEDTKSPEPGPRDPGPKPELPRELTPKAPTP